MQCNSPPLRGVRISLKTFFLACRLLELVKRQVYNYTIGHSLVKNLIPIHKLGGISSEFLANVSFSLIASSTSSSSICSTAVISSM